MQADKLAAMGEEYDIPKGVSDPDSQHVKVLVRPSIPNNQVSWQVFENDE